MPEDGSDPLALVRKHLRDEDLSAALDAINKLLEKDQEDISAHQLRIEALIRKFHQPEKLLESLTLLKDLAPEIYQESIEKINEALQAHLSELYDEVLSSRHRRPLSMYMDRIDKMLILAAQFPLIYFARGLVYKLALTDRVKRSSDNNDRQDDSPFAALTRLSSDRSENQRQRPRNPLSRSTEMLSSSDDSQWKTIAVESFEAAIQGFAADDARQLEIYDALANLYIENDEPLEALLTCKAADERGIDVEDLREQLTERLQTDATARILNHLDMLLANGEFDKASALIARYMPQPPTEDWQLREAELALLCGDLAHSAQLYDLLIYFKHTDKSEKG